MVDFSCDVSTCSRIAESGIYCNTHSTMIKRHGVPEPEFMLGFYENHIGNLKIKVFDDYLSQSPFIFGFNVETGELVNTVKFRDPNWDADKVKGK